MGLSIHYHGSFNPKVSLSAMIQEVKDIAEIYKWKFLIFEDSFPDIILGKAEYMHEIYGICFIPPESEPVYLCFLSNGKMSSPINMEFYGNSTNTLDQQYLYMLSVKTQYAGVEIHKLIIHLLKHLSGKYLQDFIVQDEGHYWESGDEKLLQETFKLYTEFIESFASSIEIYPKLEGESFETYFARLLKQIHNKNQE